jgi:hypothetical protein
VCLTQHYRCQCSVCLSFPYHPPCSDVIAFKAVIPGDNGASSTTGGDKRRLQATPSTLSDKVKAFAMASGSYTFYLDDAEGVGASNTTASQATTVHDCLAACDKDGACAAAVMRGVTSFTANPNECVLLRGDTTPGLFKRSMTKTVVSRLDLSVLFSAV